MSIYQAFIVALAPFIQGVFSSFFSCQATVRPIFLGLLTGILCGNVCIGATMGALMEALFLGVISIGGVKPSDTIVATTVVTGLVIFQGLDVESAVAIAAVVGTVTNSFSAVQAAGRAAWHPLCVSYAKKGKWNGMYIMMWIGTILFKYLWNAVMSFIYFVLGEAVIKGVIASVPTWLLGGLKAAGSMLIVIGLAITTQTIWMKNAFVYVLAGFCLSKYFGLKTLPITFIAIVLAVLTFSRDKELNELRNAAPAAKGDDFYG